MMFQTLEATLDPQGKVHRGRSLERRPSGVDHGYGTCGSSEHPGQGNAASVLAFLRQNRLPDAMRLTAEQIEDQVQAERNA